MLSKACKFCLNLTVNNNKEGKVPTLIDKKTNVSSTEDIKNIIKNYNMNSIQLGVDALIAGLATFSALVAIIHAHIFLASCAIIIAAFALKSMCMSNERVMYYIKYRAQYKALIKEVEEYEAQEELRYRIIRLEELAVRGHNNAGRIKSLETRLLDSALKSTVSDVQTLSRMIENTDGVCTHDFESEPSEDIAFCSQDATDEEMEEKNKKIKEQIGDGIRFVRKDQGTIALAFSSADAAVRFRKWKMKQDEKESK